MIKIKTALPPPLKIWSKLILVVAPVLLMLCVQQAFAQVVDSGNIKLFQKFTPASGTFSLTANSRIVFLNSNGQADNERLIEKLNSPRGLLQKLRYATGFNLLVTTIASGAVQNGDIVLSDTPDAVLTVLFNTTTLTIDNRKRDIGLNVEREGYQYNVGATRATLKFKEDLGAIRAIQSLINIVMQDGNGLGAHRSIPRGTGIDYPLFEDRTIMLDVGRWFTPKEQLIAFLDKMGEHKLNVLHLHLNEETRDRNADDTPSSGNDWTGYFRLDIGDTARQRRVTPDGRYYTKDDWDNIMSAARRNGIEIIPEFGSPGHSMTWLQDCPHAPSGTQLPSRFRLPAASLDAKACPSGAFLAALDDPAKRPPNLDTDTSSEREKIGAYMRKLIRDFRDWFETDTFHIGLDEGFANDWADEVIYANVNLVPHIKCGQAQAIADKCYDTVRMWSTYHPPWGKFYRHPLNNINFDPEYGFWLVGTSVKSMTNANTRWVDAGTGRYWVPFHTGYLRYNQLNPSHLYDSHGSGRDGWDNHFPNIPFGLQFSLWNDRTYSTARRISDIDPLINVGIAGVIPGMGLIGWNSQFTVGGTIQTYNQVGYDNLIPIAQEASSYLLADRFPYLTQQVAMSIFTDTARYAKIKKAEAQDWSSDYVVAGDQADAWTAWDPVDMSIAFAGPKTLRGNVVADIAGEGNMMSGSNVCNDLGYLHFQERAVSACDEDTWSNVIEGSGSLTKKGVGHLRLLGTAANTFMGGVRLEGGILEIGSAGSLGHQNGAVTFAGGTISFAEDTALPATRGMVIASGTTGAINANGNSASIAGVISGSGALKIVSMSKVTMTSMRDKELVGGAGTVTVMVPVITTIQLRQSAIPGTVVLAGTNTFEGGLVLESGILEVAANTALGDASGDLTFDGGELRFASAFNLASARGITLDSLGGRINTNGNDVQIAGVISGSGALSKSGQGRLELTGTNTYTGSTFVGGGVLASDLGNILDASNLITGSGGTIELSASADGKHDGNIIGSGVFRKAGSSDLTLKGTSAADATWEIAAGKLVSENEFLSDVSFTGTGARTFEFKRSSDLTYAGVFSGNGGLLKSGGGALVLTGDSRNFAGTFGVESNSTMFVDNMLGGNVNVAANGVLGGNGRVGGNVVVAASGKLLDGRASARRGLRIGGNLQLQGEYEVNFGKGLVVDGTADISAGTLKVLSGLFAPYNFDNDRSDSDSSQFNVLQSGGAMTGEFSSVDTSMLPFMAVSVVYNTEGTGGTVRLAAGLDDNALANLLGIALPSTPPPVVTEDNGDNGDDNGDNGDNNVQPERPALSPKVNVNKNRLAETIHSYTVSLDNGDVAENAVIEKLKDAIMVLTDDDGAGNGNNPLAKTAMEKRDEILESVLPEMHASSKSVKMIVSSDIGNQALNQVDSAFGGTGGIGVQGTRFNLAKKKWGFADGDSGAALWVKTLASAGFNEGKGQFADVEYDDASALFGIDASFARGLRLGALVGVSKLDFAQLGVDSSGEDDGRHVGVYGGLHRQSFSFKGGLVYSSHGIVSSREAMVYGKLASEYKAKTYGLFAEVSGGSQMGNAIFEPFVGLNYVRQNSDRYDEYDSSGAAIFSIAKGGAIMSRAQLGLRTSFESLGARVFNSLAWHVPVKEPDSIVRQTLGGFLEDDAQGIPLLGGGGSLQLGLDYDISEDLKLNMSYNYLRPNSASHKYSFEGKLVYQF